MGGDVQLSGSRAFEQGEFDVVGEEEELRGIGGHGELLKAVEL